MASASATITSFSISTATRLVASSQTLIAASLETNNMHTNSGNLPQVFRSPNRLAIFEPDSLYVGGDYWSARSADGFGGIGGDFSDDPPPRSPFGFSDRPTELANAEYFNQQYGQDFMWNTTRRNWMFWSGAHWEDDVKGYAQLSAKDVVRKALRRMQDNGVDPDEAIKFAKRSETARSVNASLTLMTTESGRSTRGQELDASAYLVNCANGTLDLSSTNPQAGLREHDRGDYLKTCLSTPYEPSATAARWAAFLAQIMAGDRDMIEYLQRLAGYRTSGQADLQELYIAHGPGANGKSVFFDTLLSVLEGYASTAPESLLTSRSGSDHPTSVARLVGKRMVVASETEAGANLRVQQMKRLTGDSTLTARFMRQDYFEFRRTFKLIMITNNRPRIAENTDAVWRRLRLIPFDVVILEQERDPELLTALKALHAVYHAGLPRPTLILQGEFGCYAVWRTDAHMSKDKFDGYRTCSAARLATPLSALPMWRAVPLPDPRTSGLNGRRVGRIIHSDLDAVYTIEEIERLLDDESRVSRGALRQAMSPNSAL